MIKKIKYLLDGLGTLLFVLIIVSILATVSAVIPIFIFIMGLKIVGLL